ncbi:hypothetical protein K502DRAFT_330138 [Neoconidiobolus thromboides FSU 785]|nr:hypothetical protein K502DRAFT_330138 [Neoconidiobolus thromboides FSU 785]
MAQCLGYDINNSLFNTIDVTFTRYNKLFEGNNIWKTLHLTYIVLSASIPDMPFIKFEVKDPLPFTIENQSKRDNEIDYKTVSELPYVYIQDYIDVKVKITAHIQKVKETYKSIKDYSKLPIDALILPQNEFTNCLGMLKNLIQDQKLIRDESHYTRKELNERTNSYEFNFKRYLKVLIQHVSIILYYPCIMIYPQPVHFEKSKLKLLFHYSNQVITYCLNIGLNKKLKSKKFTRIRQFGPKLPFQSNISIPFYYQMCYPFFALTNLLHHTSNLCEEDRLLFNESKIKCVLLVQELYNVSKSNDKRHAKDSNNALNQIKYCIHRFQLPSDLIEKISIYLN